MHAARQQQTPLGLQLAEAIQANGPITFCDFMNIALYHPEAGYYTNPTRPRLGWEGDFITSSDLHPLFGTMIGRYFASIWQLMGKPQPFIISEVGAGRGLLARDIIAWANEPESDAPAGFMDALQYTMIDVAAGDAGQRTWGTSGDVVSDLAPHISFSNELIDAFPVHIVERVADGLAEVYVTALATPPNLGEILGPLSTPDLNDYMQRYAIDWLSFPIGWRGEINLQAETWMAHTVERLATLGCVITIDYGYSAADLYSMDRPHGTLLGYRQHIVTDTTLAFVGEQDLTAHVNFTALTQVGDAHGLATVGMSTQRDFLISLGIREASEQLGQRLYPKADSERHTDAGQIDYLRRSSLRQRINTLLSPEGLGGFRVLVQQRGIPSLQVGSSE